MNNLISEIREEAANLLATGEVDMVLGYAKGKSPMSSIPFAARTEEEARTLWWDDFCVMNLANFIPTPVEGRIAIVAKGCDARSLKVRIQDGLVEEDRLTVLGVWCQGMVDAGAILRGLGPGKTATETRTESDGVLRVSGPGFTELMDRSRLLRTACRTCRHPRPYFYDRLFAAPDARNPVSTTDQSISAPRDNTASERAVFFREMFEDCLFCMACRQACPACLCEKCFADQNKDLWMKAREEGRIDSLDFHMTRAFHLAGRCTDCGACESACPMDIPVRELTAILNENLRRTRGLEAGVGAPPNGGFRLFEPTVHERRARRP